MDPHWPHTMNEFVAEMVAAEGRVLEEACETALQFGFCGVSCSYGFEDDADGNQVFFVEARPDPTVPYGMIRRDGRVSPMGVRGVSPDA